MEYKKDFKIRTIIEKLVKEMKLIDFDNRKYQWFHPILFIWDEVKNRGEFVGNLDSSTNIRLRLYFLPDMYRRMMHYEDNY